MGRPPLVSPELLGKLVAAIRAGATVSGAAQAAGIHRATFHRWMARGTSAKKGQYRDLWEAVTKALAESEIAHVVAICTAARGRPAKFDQAGNLVQAANPGDWRASAWLLERRFPKRYGRRSHHTVAGDPEAPAVFTMALPPLQDGKGDE